MFFIKKIKRWGRESSISKSPRGKFPPPQVGVGEEEEYSFKNS
jgi:hypothetical protein